MLLSGLLLAPGCGGASPGEWQIAFPAFRDGDWGIYVVGRDGGRPVRIGASSELAFGESLLASPESLSPRAVSFLCHYPSAFAAWGFPSVLPCGVRTFLEPRRTRGHPACELNCSPASREA